MAKFVIAFGEFLVWNPHGEAVCLSAHLEIDVLPDFFVELVRRRA